MSGTDSGELILLGVPSMLALKALSVSVLGLLLSVFLGESVSSEVGTVSLPHLQY